MDLFQGYFNLRVPQLETKNAFEVVVLITQIFQYVKIHIVQQIFRTDLISAMKLPDHQNLSPDNYITISDPWRQEWERGVQVMI